MAYRKVNASLVKGQQHVPYGEKPCDRCGVTTHRNASRSRRDGLRLCRDCQGDRWLIEKFGR